MGTLTIRNIDDDLKSRLRVRAAHNSRSMEEEARQILGGFLAPKPDDIAKMTLLDAFTETFGKVGGVNLPEREQEPVRDPPAFD